MTPLLTLKKGKDYYKQLAVPRIAYGGPKEARDIRRLWPDFASVGIRVDENPWIITAKHKCSNCGSIAISNQFFACGTLIENNENNKYTCLINNKIDQISHEYFAEKASQHRLYDILFQGYFFNSAKVCLDYSEKTGKLSATTYIRKENTKPFEFWHLATTPEELVFMFDVLEIEMPKKSRKALLSLILKYAIAFFSPTIFGIYLQLKLSNKPINVDHISFLHILFQRSSIGYGIETIPPKGGCGEVRFHNGYLEFNRIFNYEMCQAIKSCGYNPFLHKQQKVQ